MKKFMIGKFNAVEALNPYIIAEIGVNHEGSMETAKQVGLMPQSFNLTKQLK